MTVFLILGNQSLKATVRAAFEAFNRRQLILVREATSGIALSGPWLVVRVLFEEPEFLDASKR
jgi:hypothetical protein